MKQTAVEWLITELNQEINYIPIIKWDRIRDLIQRAKQMEKHQIKGAWLSAWKDSMLNPLEDKYYEPEAEQYYNEEYGNETTQKLE